MMTKKVNLALICILVILFSNFVSAQNVTSPISPATSTTSPIDNIFSGVKQIWNGIGQLGVGLVTIGTNLIRWITGSLGLGPAPTWIGALCELAFVVVMVRVVLKNVSETMKYLVYAITVITIVAIISGLFSA